MSLAFSFVRRPNWTAPKPLRPKRACPYKILDEHVETATGHVSISTMHLAKGFEFAPWR